MMNSYELNEPPRRGVWKHRLRIFFGCLFVLVLLLILPLPGPMARARHRWLTAGSGDADSAERPSYSFDQAQGAVQFIGPTGNWEMKIHSCTSGEHRGFYGVSFAEDNPLNTTLRVVQPEDGSDHLTLSSANGSLQVIPKADCSLWDVSIKEINESHNVSYVVAGHTHFTCTLPDSGGQIRGDVQIRSCG